MKTYLIYHFKVHGQGGGRRKTANLPLTRSSDAHFLRKKETFSHTCTHGWSLIGIHCKTSISSTVAFLVPYIVWNTGSFGVQGHTWPDRTRYLQLSWGLIRKRQMG